MLELELASTSSQQSKLTEDLTEAKSRLEEREAELGRMRRQYERLLVERN